MTIVQDGLVNSIIIRHIKEKDLGALEWDGEYTHYRQLYQDAYRQKLEGNAVLWLGEAPDSGLITQLFVQLESHRRELADGKKRAYIYGFRVKPLYRGQGIGRLMMGRVELDLIQRGFCTVTLNVSKNNEAAYRFYHRIGYRIAAPEDGRWSYIDHIGQRRYVNDPSWRLEKVLKK